MYHCIRSARHKRSRFSGARWRWHYTKRSAPKRGEQLQRTIPRVHTTDPRVVAAANELRSRTRGLPLPKVIDDRFKTLSMGVRRSVNLLAPEIMSVARNRDELLSLIYEYRRLIWIDPPRIRGRPKTVVIDLKDVKQLSIEAALVVTAEYHNNCSLREGFKPVIDDESWSKEVRALLEMLGFYKMVEAIERTGEVVTTNTSIRFVQFRSSKQVVGASAEEIIDDLRAAGGETPAREWAYAALLEAIHNVANHAYPPEDEPPVIRNANMWWAAGAYHPKNQILQFVVYDRGVGIPFTLPKKSIFEAMILRGAPEWSDADLIKGGIEFGRTSTQQPERGNGLWTICQFVDQLPGSNVDIWSGKGAVRYHSNGKIETKNYANPFCGTLIKWNLKLPTDPQQVPAMS